MADKNFGSGSGGSERPVGQVFVIFGDALAIAPDGTVRTLAPNTPILTKK